MKNEPQIHTDFIRVHPFYLWLSNIGNKHEKDIKPFIREQEF